MKELGLVLAESWRGFRSGVVFWSAPLLLVVGLVVGVAFSVASRSPGFMVLFLGLGLWAYMAMALAGFSGAGAVACRGAKAASKDFSEGAKRCFWRSVGLLGLAVAVQVAVYVLLGLVAGVALTGRLAVGGNFDPAAMSGFLLASPGFVLAAQILVVLTQIGILLLFGFGAASVGLENVPVIEGVGRGLRFVGRRFGLAMSLIVVGLLLVRGPSYLISLSIWAKLQAIFGGGGAISDPSAVAASLGRVMPLALLNLVYVFYAVPYVLMTFFVGYGREGGLLQPCRPVESTPASPAPPPAPAGPTPASPDAAGPASEMPGGPAAPPL